MHNDFDFEKKKKKQRITTNENVNYRHWAPEKVYLDISVER